MTKVKKPNYQLIIKIELMLLVLLGIVAGYSLINKNPPLKEVIAMATTVKPETLTELYFEDHTNLPKDIKRFQNYRFTFATHNAEYTDMIYPYEVYLEQAGQKMIIETGTFTLPHDGYKSITVDFGPLWPGRSKIVVNLKNKNQAIAFWMEVYEGN